MGLQLGSLADSSYGIFLKHIAFVEKPEMHTLNYNLGFNGLNICSICKFVSVFKVYGFKTQ